MCSLSCDRLSDNRLGLRIWQLLLQQRASKTHAGTSPTRGGPHCGLDLAMTHTGCPVVSVARALAADPLSPVGCEMGPPWIGFALAHPAGARLNWELRTTCPILTLT